MNYAKTWVIRGLSSWLITIVFLFLPNLYAGVPQSWSSTSPTNRNLTAAVYGQGQYFVVGWGSMIIKSSDSSNWTRALQLGGPPGSGSLDHFYAAAYGNGMFVAGGQGFMLRANSTDGVNWTNTDTLGMEHIYGLTFGNGRFVGVGYGALIPIYIITSTDGIHWTSPGAGQYPTSNTLFAVTYGNGLYVAVGDKGTILSSPDGVTWTLHSCGITKNLRAVTYTGSRFMAGGESGTMATSVDGLSWTTSQLLSFDVNGLASGNGAVVAVGAYNGAGRLIASTDGVVWSGTAMVTSQSMNGVGFVNDRFIALGNNGLIMQSERSEEHTSELQSRFG